MVASGSDVDPSAPVMFDQGPSCLLPSTNSGAILVSLPACPLSAGLTHVLGALDLSFIAAESPNSSVLDACSLLITDQEHFDALADRIPGHVRVVVFTTATCSPRPGIVCLHPSTSTSTLLELAAAWAQTDAAGLSIREREILALVSRGLSNEEIARQCYVSTATVKTHLLRSFRKLGVSDRAAAVYKAVKMGLIV